MELLCHFPALPPLPHCWGMNPRLLPEDGPIVGAYCPVPVQEAGVCGGDRCNDGYAMDVFWGLFGILPFPYLLFKPKHYFKWWQCRLGCPRAAGPGDQEGIPLSGGTAPWVGTTWTCHLTERCQILNIFQLSQLGHLLFTGMHTITKPLILRKHFQVLRYGCLKWVFP